MLGKFYDMLGGIGCLRGIRNENNCRVCLESGEISTMTDPVLMTAFDIRLASLAAGSWVWACVDSAASAGTKTTQLGGPSWIARSAHALTILQRALSLYGVEWLPWKMRVMSKNKKTVMTVKLLGGMGLHLISVCSTKCPSGG